MTNDFTGKVALVTGGARGMGFATAMLFASRGAAVALANKDDKELYQAVEEIKTQGHQAIAVECDVTDELQVEEMVRKTVEEYGRLDFAYNNAGINAQ